MSQYLVPVIAACATWLDRAYVAATTPILAAMAHVQARQAATAAAWLRYPTEMDAGLVYLAGAGGTGRLDAVVDAPAHGPEPWRTWVDEVVVSWAACLLTDAALARLAVRAATRTDHASGLHIDFRPLLQPDRRDLHAVALLRHPDVMAPVVRLHRDSLLARLGCDEASPNQ